MLRYANEFNGVRVAAGIGYEDATDRFTANSCVAVANIAFAPAPGPGQSAACVNPPGAGPANLVDNGEVKAWGAGLSLLHVPSGLFAQGHYMAANYDDPRAPLTQTTTYWGQVLGHKDSTQWLIQAGITKNWFGFGNTALFGEYSRNNDWGAGIGAGRNFSAAAIPGAVAVNGVTDTDDERMGPWRDPEPRRGCNRAVLGLAALRPRDHLYGRVDRSWRVCRCSGRPQQEFGNRQLRCRHRWCSREVLITNDDRSTTQGEPPRTRAALRVLRGDAMASKPRCCTAAIWP